jgi:hypothetical protein
MYGRPRFRKGLLKVWATGLERSCIRPFSVRYMTAGHDGCCGSGSQHCGALVWRDDEADFPDPGPDHFAVAVLGLLARPAFDRA